MDNEKLELISRTAVIALRGSNWSMGLSDVYTLFPQLESGISAYDLGEWIKSAEQFIKVWRYSENYAAAYLSDELSLYNVPESLDEQLSWSESRAHTIRCLGIYALHDAATAYYQAPNNGYNPGTTRFALSSYLHLELREEENEIALPSQGLVTGESLKISQEIKGAGVPIASLVRVLDPIGQILSDQKTCKGIAYDISLLCIKASHMMKISNANLLSVELQELCRRRVTSHLSLVIVTTIRGTQWVKRAGLKTLEMAIAGLPSADLAWKRRLAHSLRVAKGNPLSIMLLEAVQ
ncbi:hypothetical protein B0O99DRAFT_696109 [Bisporella sp. PMI_857]|nr:hypothetical protein B0O99DRAFT_696109 [Bisporella sp. PMI_857]